MDFISTLFAHSFRGNFHNPDYHVLLAYIVHSFVTGSKNFSSVDIKRIHTKVSGDKVTIRSLLSTRN
jgi:hypothetical protein